MAPLSAPGLVATETDPRVPISQAAAVGPMENAPRLAAQVTEVTDRADVVLPEGWQVFNGPNTGRPYYHDSAVGLTTWDRPLSQAKAVRRALGIQITQQTQTAADTQTLPREYPNIHCFLNYFFCYSTTSITTSITTNILTIITFNHYIISII